MGGDDRKTARKSRLECFRATLTEIYGDRIERVVLFGSRARGDAREDSDYDVAVFLRDYAPGTTTELYRLADQWSAKKSPVPGPQWRTAAISGKGRLVCGVTP